jgi:hypothetical protein
MVDPSLDCICIESDWGSACDGELSFAAPPPVTIARATNW